MDDDTICHHLEQLAAHLEIKVRYEPSAGKAGLCILHGEKTIFVDERLNLKNRANALARLLCPFDSEDMFLPPVVRELLGACRQLQREKEGDTQGPAAAEKSSSDA